MQRFLIVGLVLLLFLVSGCSGLGNGGTSSTPESSQTNTSDTSTSSSSSTQPEEPPVPPEPKYHAYELCYHDATLDYNLLRAVDSIECEQVTYVTEETEAGIPDRQFLIGDLQVTGRYNKTQSVVTERVAKSREYFVPSHLGSVYVDVATDRIVEVRFHVSSTLDGDKTTILTQSECKEIALDFLASVGVDAELESYTLTENGLQTSGEGTEWCHNYYGFGFVKYIDGYRTHNVHTVCITEYGSVMFYNSGDAIEEEKVASLQVDYERAEAVTIQYAEQVCAAMEQESVQYRLGEPYYLLLDRGVHALCYTIYIDYKETATDTLVEDVWIWVMVPLEDG